MECESFKQNLKRCNCTYEPCPRKGNCCQCLEYHRRRNELPACYFSDADEKTWDRSIRFFIKCQNK